MNRGKQKNYTLVETLITIVVVAILASISIPSYFKGMERSYNRQARSMIHLILTGEKMYYVESGKFVACSSKNSGFREVLRIDVPTQRWDYEVSLMNETAGTISAKRRLPKSNGRTWTLTFDPTTAEDANATCSGDDGYCKYQ